MATHLARHGVPVVVDRLDGKDAGAALLRRCAMLDADLLVVGAKAQVRVVDLVLGDATRTLFDQARIPLLLAT
jgi:nucleotide-binding universal stress UspA family protein